ncbi:MAG TPA: Gfo/Idh/MocA family oxidoreductase [Methylomirabilota bacterium]|nr:Gfo/Idh/MocA family oxidoreductase [Methylomirabilota bacterium]
MKYLVVGLGNIGQRRARLLGPRCVATVDPANPGATVRTVDDVAAASYDAVILATPNDTKLDYVGRFLAEGKPVLVEKPLLFGSRTQAEALARRARGGAIWYTSYNHRFEPLIARMRQLLAEGAVGKLDRVRMLYGNGTVRDWIGSWRESGGGVLEDLGCHLLDLCGFLLGHEHDRYVLWDLRPVESGTFDYGLFASADRRVVLEVGNVFWKNCFRIEIWGSAGSLHLDGLGKWGDSTLIHRTRVLPSGVPGETCEEQPAGDRTWAADLAEFERRVAAGEGSLDNDWRIAEALASLLEQSRALAPRGNTTR